MGLEIPPTLYKFVRPELAHRRPVPSDEYSLVAPISDAIEGFTVNSAGVQRSSRLEGGEDCRPQTLINLARRRSVHICVDPPVFANTVLIQQ